MFLAINRHWPLVAFLVKQGINNLLFLPHILLSLFESVAFTFDINDSAMMQYPVMVTF
jgi:hypothetical protein